MHPKRILVTGVSGFIGSWLHRELGLYFPNAEFALISSLSEIGSNTILRKGSEIFPNENQVKLMREVDCLLLNGSQTPKNKNDINKNYDSNLEFIRNLTRWTFPNLEKIIHASSIDVYAKSNHIITEKSKVSDFEPYSASKIECEKYIENHCLRNGISYTNIRIGHTYGTGDEVYKKIIPNLYAHFIKGEPIFLPEETPHVSLNLLYVGDLVRIYARLIQLDHTPTVINAINSNSIELSDLISIFEKIYKKQIQSSGLYTWNSKPNLYSASELLKWVDINFVNLSDSIYKQKEYYAKYFSS